VKKHEPTTLLEAIRYFADQDICFDFVKRMRWGNGPATCPRCAHQETSFLTTRRIWKCKGCKRQFSLKVGTIFEDSPLGFDVWLPAIWLIANSKNGISSHEMGRALGITQKTAWFVLHRVRLAMKSGTFQRLSGTVEADETYVGGASKNMHARVRRQKIKAHGGGWDKVIVAGQLERGGTIHVQVITDTGKPAMHRNILANVESGAALYTDKHSSYGGLDAYYAHKTVDHATEYVSGDVHINSLEGFWSLFKRSLHGTYISVSAGHMSRYLDERIFAYTYRDSSDLGRLKTALSGTPGRRITYKELVGRP
jgi:transposase-like protein